MKEVHDTEVKARKIESSTEDDNASMPPENQDLHYHAITNQSTENENPSATTDKRVTRSINSTIQIGPNDSFLPLHKESANLEGGDFLTSLPLNSLELTSDVNTKKKENDNLKHQSNVHTLKVSIPTDSQEELKAAARAYALTSTTSTKKPRNKVQKYQYNHPTSVTYQRFSQPAHKPPSQYVPPPVQPLQHKHYQPISAGYLPQPGKDMKSTSLPYHTHQTATTNIGNGSFIASNDSLKTTTAPLHQQQHSQQAPPTRNPNDYVQYARNGQSANYARENTSRSNSTNKSNVYGRRTRASMKSEIAPQSILATDVGVFVPNEGTELQTHLDSMGSDDDENLDEYAIFVKLLGIDMDDEEVWKMKDDDDEEFQLDPMEDDDEDDEEDAYIEDDDEELISRDKTSIAESKSQSHGSILISTMEQPPDIVTKSDPVDPDGNHADLWDSTFYEDLAEELNCLEEEDMEAAVATLLLDYPSSSNSKKPRTTTCETTLNSPVSKSPLAIVTPLTPCTQSSPDADTKSATTCQASLQNNASESRVIPHDDSAITKNGLAGEMVTKANYTSSSTLKFPRISSAPSSLASRNAAVVTPAQYEQLHQLLEKHHQLLVQQSVLAARAAHSQRLKRTSSQPHHTSTVDDNTNNDNNIGEFTNGTETSDDLVEILDGAVGMLQDLDQNRKDAIRHYVQFHDGNSRSAPKQNNSTFGSTRSPKRSLLPELMDDKYKSIKPGTDRRLTRAQFSKTLLEQSNGQQRTVFDVQGLSRLKDTFNLIDKSVEGVRVQGNINIFDLSTNYQACRHVLEQAGTKIEEDLVPGCKDLSMNFSDDKEYFGPDFKAPCSRDQEIILRRNRNLFTSGEDNLVLRGVNLYGEKQWMLIADRFLPDRSINIISQRYSKLCFMLYKANGIHIDEKGNLDPPPKLESVDDLDEVAVNNLKKVSPPAILNVHRWSLEEDLTLLQAVPIMGSMWAELRARLIPHRDRGHLRKRYQVLERRVKATVTRISKHEKIVPIKVPTSTASSIQSVKKRSQNTKISSSRQQSLKPRQQLPPLLPSAKTTPSLRAVVQSQATVNQAASILTSTRAGRIGGGNPPPYTPVLPSAPPLHSSPPRGPPAISNHPGQHYSPPGHSSLSPASHFNHLQSPTHSLHPYPHHQYGSPMHPPPNYHGHPHHQSPASNYPYHYAYHPPHPHYSTHHQSSYHSHPGAQIVDETSRAAYEKLVHDPSQEWSHMSDIKKAIERNDADTEAAASITQLAKSPAKPRKATNEGVDEMSKDSFANMHLENTTSGLTVFDGCRPSPEKCSTVDERGTEGVSFLAGVLERSNHNRHLGRKPDMTMKPPLPKVPETAITTPSKRSTKENHEIFTPTTRSSLFSNPGTPFGMSPGFRMSPNSKDGFSPGGVLNGNSQEIATPNGATLDTFPGGQSMDSYDVHGFFSNSRTNLGFGASPRKKNTPTKTVLFGDSATPMDYVAVSALTSIKHSPAKSPYSSKGIPDESFQADISNNEIEGKSTGKRKSLFDKVVGDADGQNVMTAKKSNATKKRKLKF